MFNLPSIVIISYGDIQAHQCWQGDSDGYQSKHDKSVPARFTYLGPIYDVERAKLLYMEEFAIVEKDDALILYMDNQVGFAVSIGIAYLARDGGQVLPIAEQYRPDVDMGMGGVATGELDNLHVPVQINKDKVRLCFGAVVVTHDGIHLRGAWVAVVQVVLVDAPPGAQGTQGHYKHNRDHHADQNCDQREAVWLA